VGNAIIISHGAKAVTGDLLEPILSCVTGYPQPATREHSSLNEVWQLWLTVALWACMPSVLMTSVKYVFNIFF
jgi:hypothetical protein